MKSATAVYGKSNHCMYCILLWKLCSEIASFMFKNA